MTVRGIHHPSSALRTMRVRNPNAMAAMEGDKECFLEDVQVDGRWFRLEYQCHPDGSNALAFCRHNPWGPDSLSILDSHLMGDGSICTSARAHAGGDDLAFTIDRARFWCVGYAFLRQHGIAETRRVLGPDW
ncbi:MAG TPA: hypothetical protein VK507_06870 [Iamia sp.]|nr:hypothetical protein [Iamia sp.]